MKKSSARGIKRRKKKNKKENKRRGSSEAIVEEVWPRFDLVRLENFNEEKFGNEVRCLFLGNTLVL